MKEIKKTARGWAEQAYMGTLPFMFLEKYDNKKLITMDEYINQIYSDTNKRLRRRK